MSEPETPNLPEAPIEGFGDHEGFPVEVLRPTPHSAAEQMLMKAIENGAAPEVIQKFMELHERHEANMARKAFVAALAVFKAEGIIVTKGKKVDFESKRTGEKTSYRHATLDQVVDAIGPALAANGLSFRWKIEQTPKIKVTCILMHEMGHFETCEMEALPDDSGSKNAIQAAGSAVTYLQRYTLLAITGTGTAEDDDGRSFGMEEGPFQGHLKAMREAKTLTDLQAAYTDAMHESKGDQAAQKAIIEVKDERKLALTKAAAKEDSK